MHFFLNAKSAGNFAFFDISLNLLEFFLKVIFALFKLRNQMRAKRIKKSKIVLCKSVLECNFAHMTWSGSFNLKNKQIYCTLLAMFACPSRVLFVNVENMPPIRAKTLIKSGDLAFCLCGLDPPYPDGKGRR